jgi:hypothetical protein
VPGMADACAREATWLQTSGDTLPALLVSAGGRWDVIQAYWPGARLATQKRGIYVLRGGPAGPAIVDVRPNSMRARPQYAFFVKLTWPVKTGTSPIAETEQANFDLALADLLVRIRGPLVDKSHGGRFLSAGEVPPGNWPEVHQDDPEITIPRDRALRGSVTYRADDLEEPG